MKRACFAARHTCCSMREFTERTVTFRIHMKYLMQPIHGSRVGTGLVSPVSRACRYPYPGYSRQLIAHLHISPFGTGLASLVSRACRYSQKHNSMPVYAAQRSCQFGLAVHANSGGHSCQSSCRSNGTSEPLLIFRQIYNYYLVDFLPTSQ